MKTHNANKFIWIEIKAESIVKAAFVICCSYTWLRILSPTHWLLSLPIDDYWTPGEIQGHELIGGIVAPRTVCSPLAIFSRDVLYFLLAWSRLGILQRVASAGLADAAGMQLVTRDGDFAIFYPIWQSIALSGRFQIPRHNYTIDSLRSKNNCVGMPWEAFCNLIHQ